MLKRREFLKTTGYFVAVANLGVAAQGCGDNLESGTFEFPQGVASGDPRSSSVVLWTRAVRSDGTTDPVVVTVQVSTSEDFSTVVVDDLVTVTGESDHTLRLLVTGLVPATRYFYRFRAGADSIVGRTLTAPVDSDTAPVHLAWVSCQDYTSGTFGAYRQMLNDDMARAEAEQIQFVVHVGDFIYETVESGYQGALDENFQPFDIVDRNGNRRIVPALPSGAQFATTLDDYRHLYKVYLSDPDLQAARARWPFVQIWDDHEFSDDSWQTQANYTANKTTDEPSQTRKVAANQAWFEFVPASLSDAEGVPGVTQDASDFAPATVENTEYDSVDADNLADDANNRAALASMTIYRSIRYGNNVELVLTDDRSYRSDHPVPEELTFNNILFFAPRNAMPLEATNLLDAGMTANGGSPPDKVLGVDNPRMTSPPGTMLGPRQKQWWKDTMAGSDANWKLWGNSVPMLRLRVNNAPAGILIDDRMVSSDAWDGYNTERNELMKFLVDTGIDNVVSISGDLHAHFAGQIMDDHDAANPQPVVAELCAAGISSNSEFSFFEAATRGLPTALRELVTYDATPLGGQTRFTNNLNTMLIYGTASALEAKTSNDLTKIEAAREDVNPHLLYADTESQGYGLMTVTPDSVTGVLVTVNRPTTDEGEAGSGILRTATFTIPKDNVAAMTGPVVTGTPPFPLAK